MKTIVLPLVDTGTNGLTIVQYREKTGIDLRDIVALDPGSNRIVLKTRALYLFENTPEFSEGIGYDHVPAIAAPSNFASQAQSDSATGHLNFEISTFPLLGGMGSAYFNLSISSGRPFEYENIIVTCGEL